MAVIKVCAVLGSCFYFFGSSQDCLFFAGPWGSQEQPLTFTEGLFAEGLHESHVSVNP